MTKEAKILIAIAGAVVIGGVLLAVFANPQPKDAGKLVDSQSLLRDNTHIVGSKDAKVKVIEFGDFQCPACGAAHPIVKKIMEQYKDNPNVMFAFRNFPLKEIHPNAEISSEAAEAAGEQGKYWEMHNMLYEKQNEWSTAADPTSIFTGYASQLGLDVDKFTASVTNRQYSSIINTDYDDGTKAGVNATPSFFFNGEKVAKVISEDDFKKKIDELLAK